MQLLEYLDKHQIEHRVIRLQQPAHTALDVQRLCRCALEQVIKTLVFLSAGSVVIAVVSGNRKVDLNKLKALLVTENLRMADQEEVLRLTGYKAGTVSPFNCGNAAVFVDETVLPLQSILVGSGHPQVLIEVTPRLLITNTAARVETFAK